MFCSGAGAQPAGLRLQSERRKRVQHGPVHPAAGRGGTGSERRQDTRGFSRSVLTLEPQKSKSPSVVVLLATLRSSSLLLGCLCFTGGRSDRRDQW